ncbi:hypothetical protein [Streptomyces sp. NPDC048202]|uniref:hypothetical protein n=1 Tax=Streptomyces sp. NPDC048202 TaxID=3365514 RepID=UPI0037154517
MLHDLQGVSVIAADRVAVSLDVEVEMALTIAGVSVMTGGAMFEHARLYRELGAVGGDVLVLRDAAREVGEGDERFVLAYLEGCPEIYSAMGAEQDVIAGDVWITGAGSVATDGTWVWPTQLAHYVRRHHVALPHGFIAHIRALDYVCPEVPSNQAQAIFEEYFAESRRAAMETAPGAFEWDCPALTRPGAWDLVSALAGAGISVTPPLLDRLIGFRDASGGKREPLMGGADTLLDTLADANYQNIELRCFMGSYDTLTMEVRRVGDADQRLTFHVGEVSAPWREEAVAALTRVRDRDRRPS